MAVPLVQLTAAPSRRGRRRPRRSGAQAGLAQGEGPGRAQLRAAQGPDARARAPHGVRGGALPQHRRMLGAQGRHVHDPGRRLHPELRLLRRRPRHADGRSTRSSRCAWRRRSSGWGWPHVVITSVDRDDLPERRRRGVRRLHHRDQAPAARDLGRGADPRLQGLRAGAPDRDGGPARHPQSQPRDRRAAVPAGPAGRPLRPRARAAGRRARRMAPDALDQDAASSSAWARSGTRCWSACATSARSDVNILTLGQYLRPSDGHLPVARYYTPDEFAELRDLGLAMGFRTSRRARSPARRTTRGSRSAAATAATAAAADGRPPPHRQAAGARPRAASIPPAPTSTAAGSARCCSSAASRRRPARPTPRQDRRLLPPLHRPGGGGASAASPRSGPTTTSSAPTASTARRWRAGITPRAVMAELFGKAAGLLAAARAARCTCSTRARLPRRPRHRRRAHPARRRRRPSRSSTAAATRSCVCYFGEPR